MDAVDFLSTNSVLSVMELTKKPLTTIPENYICPDQEPVLLGLSHDCNTSLPMVPTIELEKLVIGETTDIELDKLHSVCKAWGLFQLVNHGVSLSLLNKLNNEIEEFFKLPLEEKMKYQVRPGNVEGYGRKLAMTLMELMGKALKIDKREMEELFEDGMRSVRMTYYPPCPQPELVVGFPPHSDATGITILHQVNGVEGLQIKKDGVWIPVSFIPHAFVVNVGDIMEILSNGAYTSAEHRAAVNLEKERISIAVFFNPKSEAEIEPLKSQLNTTQSPPLFRRISVEDFHKEYFFSRDLKDGKTNLEYLRIKTGEGNTD
ncbi:protein SRG1-like [Carya illinoinensis]|uniref:protein SRG1-like n=1 Tax=Carya illinoinensis TaxID=32201 RepID=UPI001C72490C|nr:protein SRG1-like [Carya illinoinensis]